MPTFVIALLLVVGYLAAGFGVCRLLAAGYWARKRDLPVKHYRDPDQYDAAVLLALAPIFWPLFTLVELGLRLGHSTNPRVQAELAADRDHQRQRALELRERENAALERSLDLAKRADEREFDERVEAETATMRADWHS